ncbi:MAG: RluA family pseudouridine synthase [Alkalibacterium sp.]|uniref:Pseudouridine synthase n=1 Tax=Alkalibacterium gilvum TaxID=1130080 RepID=A0A1H6SMI2_9LACT|nr:MULTISPECIES: RluA family pseudouridine synthase [Alkalibacterium]MDN6293936.1 RluA family pseudouridine synthase [Alkalibacterium sp.]MDN6295560.1 RluA family pseudouridine synthase [Alkalibacterium sp.]MDN6326994.1 RluA family pseudouridine synthase [Alkalibacterium sp.]SEI69119.1 23S rRNA pseudouridine1911/1915/1917 synthase [Alkalibacterium gilvum]
MKKKRSHNPKRKADKRRKSTAQSDKRGVNNYTVEEETTLLPFLLSIITNKSRNSVKSILTRGQVTVDGEEITQHNHPLKPGQTVGVMSNKESKKRSELVGLSILHEDRDIIVINKEAGLLSVAADDPTEPTAYNQLSDYVKKENPDNKIFVVHRLDRDTSGVMLYAKSEDIQQVLQNDWKNTVKERIYTALAEGRVEKEQGELSSWLKESKGIKMYSNQEDNGGKHAVTHYRKVLGNENYSLLEMELETGRKHQIRAHLKDMGHPIAGDKLYDAETNPIKRLGLHATTLVLVHPGTNKLVRYTSEVPGSFLKRVK